jgi:hypothetical protein
MSEGGNVYLCVGLITVSKSGQTGTRKMAWNVTDNGTNLRWGRGWYITG